MCSLCPFISVLLAWLLRCFPNYPGNLTTYLSPVAGSPTADNTPDISAPVSAYNTRANRWARYVGNISQGIVIIVAAGLGAGVLLSGVGGTHTIAHTQPFTHSHCLGHRVKLRPQAHNATRDKH